MNRQVAAFLSLFSLVLVLSVYYVVAPTKTNSNPVNQLSSEDEEEVSQTTYYFSSLALARDEKHQEIIDEKVALIASNDSTSEEVVKAKEAMKHEEEIMEIEEELETVVKECNFVASYVEVMDSYYNVLAYRPDMKEEEELVSADSIFISLDTYIQEKSVSWLLNIYPVIEFRY